MKLLIVDDHPILREGLAALLRQAGARTTVLQAEGVDACLDLLARHADLDAVLLDLMMPGPGGLPAIAEIAARRPGLPVIVVSSSEDAEDVRRALAAGARGYVPKSASPQTLLAALHFVLAGNVYVPPLVLAASDPRSVSGLTARQIDVLKLLGDGRSNKEIGRRLDLSEKTVKAHVTAIFRALNVVNRTQAVNAAQRRGLL